jgi:hypothetical protein
MTSRVSLALQVVIVVLLALIWLKPQPDPPRADYSGVLRAICEAVSPSPFYGNDQLRCH